MSNKGTHSPEATFFFSPVSVNLLAMAIINNILILLLDGASFYWILRMDDFIRASKIEIVWPEKRPAGMELLAGAIEVVYGAYNDWIPARVKIPLTFLPPKNLFHLNEK